MTKPHSIFVLSVAVVVGLLSLAAAMSADALAAQGSNNAELRGDKPKVLWRTTVGITFKNAPTFDPSKNWVYANGGTEVAVLDARNGTKIKNVTNDGPGTDKDGVSSVVLAGGKIFYTGAYNAYSRDATALGLNWNLTVPYQFENSPVYVPSKNALFAGSWFKSVFYRINSLTGAVVWNATEFAQGVYTRSTFSRKHNLIIFPVKDSSVAALNADTGSKMWSQPTDGQCAVGILSENEDLIYYGSTTLYAFALASGKVNWQFPVSGGVGAAPLLHNGALFFNSMRGATCYSIDANTGKQIWANTNCRANTEWNFGFARLYSDTFLVPQGGGAPAAQGVTAIALNGSGVVWSWTGTSSSVFNIATPTSDGKLFVGDNRGKVYALQLPPSGNTQGGIVEKHCADTACSSGCVTRRYKSGQCLQTGVSSSILRTCTLSGDAVFVKTFFQLSTCDVESAHNDASYAVKKCYQDTFGGSNELVSCSA